MATRTYGEYLAPVNQLIDDNFPEGTDIKPKDLKIIAALTAANIFTVQKSDAEAALDNLATEGEK